jgi:peptide/nickel transport system substrate-binding protein
MAITNHLHTSCQHEEGIVMFNKAEWKWLALGACMVLGAWAELPAQEAKKGATDTLVEPFTPPTLEELNAKAKWEKQPVLDAIELLRAKQAKEKPLATVAETLKLQNTSADNNAKILNALGRLPANDNEVDWEATFNRHLSMDIKSSNGILGSSAAEFEVTGLMGLSLFAFDWNFFPFAAAEHVVSWDSSADHLYEKVVIRDDLTWSDGEPITAHDVAFSFQTIMNPKVPVPAVRSGTDKLRWVQAYDDHTVVFFHKEALATNVWNVNFPVIPKHIYENSLKEDPTLIDSPHHVKQEASPVSGGPYKLVKRTRGQEIILERREDYYMFKGKQVRKKPYFKTIRFNIIEDRNTALLALKKGDLDEMILMPEDWKSKTIDANFYAKNTKATGIEWTSFHFLWNLKTPFFSDVRVRQAMSYAYDYDEMYNTLNLGLYERSNGIYHKTAWMYPKPAPKFYSQDLDKAEELLDAAGWEDSDGDGIRDKVIDGKRVKFEFTMLCPNIPDRLKYGTLMKECLSKIGVICNVKPMEFVALHDKLMSHDIQAAFGGWGTGADPDTSDNIWGTGEGRNYGSYSNPEIDKLYAQGRKEFDRKKQAVIYGKIHTTLYQDQPYTWLYFRNSFYGFNKELRGYMFSPRDPYGYAPGINSIWKAKK